MKRLWFGSMITLFGVMLRRCFAIHSRIASAEPLNGYSSTASMTVTDSGVMASNCLLSVSMAAAVAAVLIISTGMPARLPRRRSSNAVGWRRMTPAKRSGNIDTKRTPNELLPRPQSTNTRGRSTLTSIMVRP